MSPKARVRRLESTIGSASVIDEIGAVRRNVQRMLGNPEAAQLALKLTERHGVGPYGREALAALETDPHAVRLCELMDPDRE